MAIVCIWLIAQFPFFLITASIKKNYARRVWFGISIIPAIFTMMFFMAGNAPGLASIGAIFYAPFVPIATGLISGLIYSYWKSSVQISKTEDGKPEFGFSAPIISFLIPGVFIIPLLYSSLGYHSFFGVDRKIDRQEATKDFYRVRAAYEVIETGELIEFDFTMPCLNRKGGYEFSGILGSQDQFRATQSGEAMAIAIPKYYCQRSKENLPIEHKNDKWKMPLVAWYPNIEDLSFAIIYATNDAYTGDKSKLKFLYYSITPSDRQNFEDWQTNAHKEYVQFGALPGPFGCGNSSKNNKQTCNHLINIERNLGFPIANPSSSLLIANQYDWPQSYSDDIVDYLNIDRQYFCEYGIDPDTSEPNKKLIGRGGPLNSGDVRPVKIVKIAGDLYSSRQHHSYVYLNPDILHGLENDKRIREVYPVVHHRHPLNKNDVEIPSFGKGSARISQILRDPEWRGFGILSTRQISISKLLTDMPPLNYDGTNNSVLFVNEQIGCEKKFLSWSFDVMDLKNSHTLKISTWDLN